MARHREGLLELEFVCDQGGRTRLVGQRQCFPLRTTTPMYLDPNDNGAAFVYVQNPAGGVFGGDRLTIRAHVGPNCRIHLTTQSATKLYRMESNLSAEQQVELVIGRDAYIEWIPGMLIPQAGTRYRQEVRADLEDGATLIAVEHVAPGRWARGEQFAYERLELHLEARRGSALVCADAQLLEPMTEPLTSNRLLGGYNYLASLIAVTSNCPAEDLANEVGAALLQGGDDIFAGADSLPAGAGVIARILGRSSAETARAWERAWRIVRRAALNQPLPPRRN